MSAKQKNKKMANQQRADCIAAVRKSFLELTALAAG